MKSRAEATKPILILARSGRTLAAAAARVREPVIVVDAYADLDTAQAAAECVRLPYGRGGFAAPALLAAVAARRARIAGLVYGAGLEHRPALLAKLEALVPILGNSAATVALVKDPLRLAALLAAIGVPHPETALAPRGATGWLRKRVGGAGGDHIRAAQPGERKRRGFYYQRHAAGRPVSALLLADGCCCRIIGYSEQWAEATTATPYLYGGCAGPLPVPARLEAAIRSAAGRLVAATGLRGLNSIDLLLDGESFVLLEVNPRPGATLDLFDGVGRLSLWQMHCRAVAGHLPRPAKPARRPRAAAILYAPSALTLPPGFRWPAWTSDRSRPGTRVTQAAPICTIRAAAGTVAAARALAARRAGRILARLDPVTAR